ncbi:MAG: hypothetical protein JWM68_236 [Verrucomicrobiales bacterium]|nr:hypothetical protein [Verrucomicrobiales bacterium]
MSAPVQAQVAGTYPVSLRTTNAVASRLTNAVYAYTTNSYATSTTNSAIFACSEYDYVGLSLSGALYGLSTNGTLTVWVLRSFDDGRSYETTPESANTIVWQMYDTTNTTKCSLLDMRGATHFKIDRLINTNSVGATNFTWYVDLKTPKYGSKVATQ